MNDENQGLEAAEDRPVAQEARGDESGHPVTAKELADWHDNEFSLELYGK